MKKILVFTFVLQSSLLMTMENFGEKNSAEIGVRNPLKFSWMKKEENLIKFNQIPGEGRNLSRWCSPLGSKENESWPRGKAIVYCSTLPINSLNPDLLSYSEVFAINKKHQTAMKIGVLNNNPHYSSFYYKSLYLALTKRK